MEILIPGRIQLSDAIRHAEFNKTVKESMLTERAFANNAGRRRFLKNHTEDLGAAITLLKAIQDPATCTAQELIRIITERPEVFACVNEFTTGQILHHHELVDNVMLVSFRRTYPEAV